MGKIEIFFSSFVDKIGRLRKNVVFGRKTRFISSIKHIISFAYSLFARRDFCRKNVFRRRAKLFPSVFRDWQAEFGEDFFHILPDPLAIFL